ncbi:MAG TPA: ADOP family duplicated permease [Vicinamibacterales bacterium]|nr:ADOP family duplicated permease [Vicinamibacterales bacterium]
MRRDRVRSGLLASLLRWSLPQTPAGRSMLGDVLEEYHQRPTGIRRTLWLAGVTVSLTLPYLLARFERRGDARGGLGTIVDDARSGLRALRRDRATVVLAVVTLAVGIGSVTAMLSAIYGSLIKPLPFHDPASLVVIGDRSVTMAADRVAGNIALLNARDLGHESRTLQGLAAYRDFAPTISGVGDARQVRGQEVDAPFFDVLGVTPIAGRGLTSADQQPGAPSVVVIADRLARQMFGEAGAAVGRTFHIDGGEHTIVGVVSSVTQLGNPQLWVPIFPNLNVLRRNSRQVYAVARLAPGVAIEAARAELATRFEGLRAAHPEVGADRSAGAMSVYAWIVGERGPRLLRLLGAAVLLVLVIAAANVAGLLLLRAERRQADLAVRSALGASRSRLTRELVVEGLTIALAAALLGLVFASWCTALLVDLYGPVLPRAWEIGLHPPVIAVTMVVAGVVGLVIALAPATRLSTRHVMDRAASRTATRTSATQRTLVWGQTALAMLLVGLAGLLIASVSRLAEHDLGIDPDGVLVFDVSVAGRTGEASQFFDALLMRLGKLPGVVHTAAASRRPLFGGNNTGLALPGIPDDVTRDAILEIRAVTPGYFDALGVPLLTGRPLVASDARAAPVIVVNRTFEATFFPDTGALGRLVQPSGQARTFQVVGVVDDMREFGPTGAPRPTAYWPHGNGPYGTSTWMTLVVRRDRGDPLTLVAAARAILRDLDPQVALDAPATLAELAANQVGRDRLAVRALLTLAGALALLLTVVGLYSVLSYALSRRAREIGIRRALGATRGGIVRLLIGQGMRLAGPGLLGGLFGVVLCGRFVAAYLYDVGPGDPATLAGAAALLGAACLAASALPAWRGGRIEPVEALRRE